MKFLWCTLTVNNLEESLKFYQEIVGLSLEQRFVAEQTTEIAFLGSGETKVELLCHHGVNATEAIGQGISLGFEVQSVDEMIKFIQGKGLEVASGLKWTPLSRHVI